MTRPRPQRTPPRPLQPGSDDELLSLLGRAPVDLHTPQLQRMIAGKTILVTGAGGSIGSEICRQAMRFSPRRLVCVDRAEGLLFETDRELRERWVGMDIVPAVADITDRDRMARLLDQHGPHVLIHAAAHKHVPMMESNPGEAIKNNIFGTAVVAELAAEFDVGTFVLVSTDKAVRPTSVMGASKRVAEMVVASLAEGTKAVRHSGTQGGHGFDLSPSVPQCLSASVPLSHGTSVPSPRFSSVRFGNVLGSSGSVVPIFKRQIDAGGPVTVTHAAMTRYFMSIPEAAGLVMQAGAIGQGGETFVLDMGQPVKITELAEAMIRRRGLEPGKDIDLRFTGIRPGEKLHEQLAGDDEHTLQTMHEKIRVWELPTVTRQDVSRILDRLESVINEPAEVVKAALAAAVPDYSPAGLTMRLVGNEPARSEALTFAA